MRRMKRKIKNAVSTFIYLFLSGFWAALVLTGAWVIGQAVYDILKNVCPQFILVLLCVYVTMQIWEWAERVGNKAMDYLDSRFGDSLPEPPEVPHDEFRGSLLDHLDE